MGSRTDAQIMQSGKTKFNPYIKILEQPASKAVRFRYECEGRSAGSILGANSTLDNKTYPAIQVCGYKGRAIVVVSCVSKDQPYRPHPYNLVGKEGCRKGVCTIEINPDTMVISFNNLGIQCVKKKDIDESIKIRESIRVDPFRTGFTHRFNSTDLNAVRLCFQVFLKDTKGKYTIPIDPVLSDPIFDKKAKSELIIYQLSDCSCIVTGGRTIILLCDKVVKEDISVRFFEEQDGNVVWEGYGEFNHACVHKQVAITFKTPSYKLHNIEKPVRVNIQLKRPSDGVTSDPLPFDYLPIISVPEERKRKRQKLNGKACTHLLSHLDTERHQNSANAGAMGGFIDKSKISLQQNIATDIASSNGLRQYGYLEIMPSATTFPSTLPVNSVNHNLPTYNNIAYEQKTPDPYNPLKQPDNPSKCNIAANPYNSPAIQLQSLDLPTVLPSPPAPVIAANCSSYNIPAVCNSTCHPNQYPGNSYNLNTDLKSTPQYSQQYARSSIINQQSMQQQYNSSLSRQNYNGSYNMNYSNLANMDNQQLQQYNAAEINRISGQYNHNNYNATNIASQNIPESLNIANDADDDSEQENMTDSFTRLEMNAINELANI